MGMTVPHPDGLPRKRVLCCTPDERAFDALTAGMEGTASGGVLRHGRERIVRDARAEVTWVPAHPLDETRDLLATTFFNMIAVDLRWTDDPVEHAARIGRARALLQMLDEVDDVELRYGFHRIVVLVSGPDGSRIDDLLVELGGRGIRHVLKQRSFRGGETVVEFAGRLLDKTLELTLAPRAQRSALCAAGGGITAIFFELGALKCLDDCLVDGRVNDFDMFFGISAGAVVTSMLANGFAAEEFMAAIVGVEDNRIPPVNLSMARVSHLNLQDFRWRLGVAAKESALGLWRSARAGRRPSMDAMFLGATSLIGTPFRSDSFGELLASIMAMPGATDDFRRLRRPLYIGATNQDTRRHVLWGSEGHAEVPVHKAVQASLSINPAFSAVQIDGAWYEDGAVTRTSNFTEAIRRGADLVIVLDPFVPYHSKEPGFSNRRGMLYNIDQDVRSLSYTRYESARNHALRRHPEVRTYTLLPNNRLRRLLSINPMDHRIALEVFRGSYLATLRRIDSVRHLLNGDLALHGIRLDTEPAEEIGRRLEAAGEGEVRFEDFFLDGAIRLRRPRLSLQPPLRRAGS
jgi:NTE family protein